MNQEERWG